MPLPKESQQGVPKKLSTCLTVRMLSHKHVKTARMFQAHSLIPGRALWQGGVLRPKASLLRDFPAKSNLFTRNLKITLQ